MPCSDLPRLPQSSTGSTEFASMPSAPARYAQKCCSTYLALRRRLTEWVPYIPSDGLGDPKEIADAVAWLFSERSSYYTGQSLTLDGGLTAQRPMIEPQVAEPANGFLAASPNGSDRIPPSGVSV